MKAKFVLIDFENVQPNDLMLLNGGSYKIQVFLGSHQGKIPVEVARALQAFGPDVEYVQVAGSGRNAVDFHIAYYIGRLAAAAPNAEFHIISKDTGFDPLLKHLTDQGIPCWRSKSAADIALVPATTSRPESMAQRTKAVVENLAKRKSARPRTLKTLRSTIKALFSSQLADDEVERLIEQLATRKVIRIGDGKVQYELPT